MDLTWMGAAIAGCVALAVCIAAVLLRPMGDERRRLRPIANAHRLTGLPEYVRAKRLRTRRDGPHHRAARAVLLRLRDRRRGPPHRIAHRRTPIRRRRSRGRHGVPRRTPLTDPAAARALGYFADHVAGFGTQRIGLTSPNRRVIPLTRDYQYARTSSPTTPQQRSAVRTARTRRCPTSTTPRASTTSWRLCLTGFPDFDAKAAQRRSLIYVGPASCGRPASARPALFTADRVDGHGGGCRHTGQRPASPMRDRRRCTRSPPATTSGRIASPTTLRRRRPAHRDPRLTRPRQRSTTRTPSAAGLDRISRRTAGGRPAGRPRAGGAPRWCGADDLRAGAAAWVLLGVTAAIVIARVVALRQ